MKPSEIIELLDLKPLPLEGGYYSETFRSKVSSNRKKRCTGTCIYYLLEGRGRSYWHSVRSDEIWLYHCGSPGIQVLLFPDGRWEERIIGANIAGKERPQSIIPAETWQAAVLLDINSWGLFSAVVCPGFEFEDYIPGKGSDLIEKWPNAERRIRELSLI
ncbi:MAG: cupin domain-containing protein [Victivallales bacterium]